MSVVEVHSTKRFRRKDGSFSPKVTYQTLLAYKAVLDQGKMNPDIAVRYVRSWIETKGFFDYSLMMELTDE